MPGITDIILSEIKGFRLETNARLTAIGEKVGLNSENIASLRSEVKATDKRVSTLIPRVESACKKANGANEKATSIKGQWSAGWKIAATVLGAAIIGLAGWFLRGV